MNSPRRAQRHLLDSPVAELAHEELVLVAAVDRVHETELLHLLSGLPELAHDPPVELQLVDGGIVHSVLVAGVCAVDVLVRSGSDADRRRSPDVRKLRLEGPIAVEHLDALVPGVSDVDVALTVNRDSVWRVELALPGSSRTPRLDVPAARFVLRDSRVAEAIGHVDVAS